MTRKGPAPSIHYWLPLVVWLAAILVVSSIPGPTLEKVGFSVQDKLAHAIEYSVLGFLAYRWWSGIRSAGWVAAIIAWLVGVAFGAADELHQYWIPGRVPAVYDWIADVIGCGVGVTAAAIYYALLRRSTRDAEVMGSGQQPTAPNGPTEEKAR